jgi:hypothetical protein
MNDVEHDLRELFERKASSVGGVAPRLPEPVRKRGRRGQLGTAFVSGLTVVAVLAGTVGVIRAVDTGRDRQPTPADDPWAGYEVFERIATVGNFTITSPSDWYLVNQWPWARTLATELREQRERNVEACGEEPTQDERQACRSSLMGVPGDGWAAPILMLSDTDRGLESSPCFDRSFSIGSEDAVMTIALDSVFMAANFGAGDRAQWPVPFDTPPAAERPSCGPGTYVYFASGDIPYVAHFAFGDAVPEDERRTLIDAFEGMQVDDSQEAFMDEPKPDDAAAYVIAGGENAAGPWTLELTRSSSDGPSANVELLVVSPEGGAGAGDFTVPTGTPIEQAGGDPVFGAVAKEAAGVEIRGNVLLPGPAATIVPLPPSLPFDFDLFFASHEGDQPPFAVPVGGDGNPIGNTAGISEGDDMTLFDILGTEGAIMTDRSTGITCYVVSSEHGVVDGCADEITLQTIPLPGERGQILVFSHLDAIKLSGIELDVDGAETIAGSKCHGPVCVIGIPPGSGTGTLWLLQKGQRADSAPVAWTPEGVERI